MDFIEVNLTEVLWMHHIFENWKNSSETGECGYTYKQGKKYQYFCQL